MVRSAGLPFACIGVPDAGWQALENAVHDAEAKRTECETALPAAFDEALAALPEGDLRTAVYNARKNFFQKRRPPASAFMQQVEHRVPALTQAIRACEQAAGTLQAARDACAIQYEKILEEAFRRIQIVAGEPEFQHALLFASHDLLAQMPRFLEKTPGQFAKKERQTALAVLQYATRMATRTIPLSRFATVSLYPLDGVPDPDAEPPPDFGKSVVSPNVALLEALYTVLLREPVFYRALPMRLNPCIPETTGDKAYRWLYFDGETESFQETPPTPLLHHLVDLFLKNDRHLGFAELLVHLRGMVEAEPEALESWLLDLLDTGFLEWELPETGLSPDWCSGLYRFLGFLPAEPMVVDTAALLQTLRTTARTLPYLPLEEAMSAQQAATKQVREYFEQWMVDGPYHTELQDKPFILPEQLFYEDVERPAGVSVPGQVFRDILDSLTRAWNTRPEKPLPLGRAALAAHFSEKSPAGEAVDFLEFAQDFLNEPRRDVADFPTSGGEDGLGALFQVFQENGRQYAVLNGLYPGGGKLFARWLHLFAANSQQPIANGPAFPWQGYFNANFQPRLATDALAVPGGRTRAGTGGREFLLGNLDVTAGPLLRDRTTGQALVLNDLGLEALETRPPVMQILWLLGVPYISVDALVPEGGWLETALGIRHRARYSDGNLVLARAAWTVAEEQWQAWLQATEPGAFFFFHIREAFLSLGMPRHLFAHFSGNQSQHFDLDNPLSVLLLHKLLRQGAGLLHLTEMLPVPEERAQEFAGEVPAKQI